MYLSSNNHYRPRASLDSGSMDAPRQLRYGKPRSQSFGQQTLSTSPPHSVNMLPRVNLGVSSYAPNIAPTDSYQQARRTSFSGFGASERMQYQPQLPTSPEMARPSSVRGLSAASTDQLFQASLAQPGSNTGAEEESHRRRHSMDTIDFTNEWVYDISSFLRLVRLHKYTSSLQKQGITLEKLLKMDEAELAAIGINTKGARRRLSIAIEKYNQFKQHLEGDEKTEGESEATRRPSAHSKMNIWMTPTLGNALAKSMILNETNSSIFEEEETGADTKNDLAEEIESAGQRLLEILVDSDDDGSNLTTDESDGAVSSASPSPDVPRRQSFSTSLNRSPFFSSPKSHRYGVSDQCNGSFPGYRRRSSIMSSFHSSNDAIRQTVF
eukprot:comp17952_c0_seq1/m.18278 comp17952_c0_seq1/g.18278  ORF comp17952_c0_seq1/g.18278 comp17952_c0_seq1/m.18278 type:complete len:382 (-) comp17952_c0_seq1:249-1394(-)